MSKAKYPKEGEMIMKDTYVDDILISVDSIQEAKQTARRIDEILDKGGFRVKHWIISGKSPDCQLKDVGKGDRIKILETDEEKVLGIRWNPKEDEFSFKAKVNFSPSKRGIVLGNDLKQEDPMSQEPYPDEWS